MPVYRQSAVTVVAFACLRNVGLNYCLYGLKINGKTQTSSPQGRVWPEVQTQVLLVVRQEWLLCCGQTHLLCC